MLRFLAILMTSAAVATALSADVRCDFAYSAFVQKLSGHVDQLSGQKLADVSRKAIRIFDACDSGHLANAEARFRDLEDNL